MTTAYKINRKDKVNKNFTKKESCTLFCFFLDFIFISEFILFFFYNFAFFSLFCVLWCVLCVVCVVCCVYCGVMCWCLNVFFFFLVFLFIFSFFGLFLFSGVQLQNMISLKCLSSLNTLQLFFLFQVEVGVRLFLILSLFVFLLWLK